MGDNPSTQYLESMQSKDFSRRKFITEAATGCIAAMGLPILGFGKAHLSGDKFLQDPTVPPHLFNGEAQSWVEIQNQIYGAKPESSGPIGGSGNYAKIVTGGDYKVENFQGLVEALAKAKSGQVIFIPSETVIDLTTYIYIEELVLEIPEGVTLASDRGYHGSMGALLTSDSLKTPVMIRPLGSHVRISGLRIQGPNPKRYMEHHRKAFGPGGEGHEYYYRFPVSRGIVAEHSHLEIDNCEISAFSGSGISLLNGSGHHLHHNFIHKNQYNGLGYGISHSMAHSLIEYNLFNENRHSIAGTGVPGCGYIARKNIELGISLSHCFDMHGGRDRKDKTDIAGSSIEIYNNTFKAPERAVVIRGVPEEKCEIYQNWFLKHTDPEGAIGGLSDKTSAYNNVYGEKPRVAR
jgi:hypothetical protein